MATLEKLQEKKQELEEKLYAGDLSVEASLARIDGAIAARTQKIQHSRKRLGAAKEAVQAGLSPDEARKVRSKASPANSAKEREKRPLNRFE
jgi:hypothetical protein